MNISQFDLLHSNECRTARSGFRLPGEIFRGPESAFNFFLNSIPGYSHWINRTVNLKLDYFLHKQARLAHSSLPGKPATHFWSSSESNADILKR